MKVWMVRAGKVGQDEEFAIENNLAIVEWEEMPDLNKANTKETMRNLCKETYPDDGEGTISNYAGQLYAFSQRIEKGDLVVLPFKTQPTIAIGQVMESYQYLKCKGEMRHTLPVKWVRTDLPRTDVGQDLRYSLGAFMTVCQIQRNNAEERFKAMMSGKKDPGINVVSGEEVETEETGPTDVEQIARDQILGHIEKNFRGHELTRLVEAVLIAEGYKTKASAPGPDGGIDILAGRGALGFEPPKLCVQVKSSSSSADVNILRSLQGSMQTFQADQGLLVSWGGFTSIVLKESRLSFFSVRLWDGDDLVKAVLRNYDRLPEELQNELPLKRVWALVLEE